MCCCQTPTINGQPGYRWQPNHDGSVYGVNPPDLRDGDVLLYDEPGRCGGIDSHSYHYRVVKSHAWIDLLVRHGGGEERLHLSLYGEQPSVFASLDSNARYWMLNALYHAYADGKRRGQADEYEKWYMAAAEKRITVRKDRGRDSVTVHIKPQPLS